jgi:tRNA pseudouridine38/39 synthase
MASMRRLAATEQEDYSKWTKDALIKRLRWADNELRQRPADADGGEQQEQQQQQQQALEGVKPPAKKRKTMDPSQHATRYIALKLAYLGRNYSGFEFSASGNQPSIEEELYKALTKTCLIFPEDENVFDLGNHCEYSKCGRTDRGVSAFGQVIGLRVRSARPLPGKKAKRKAAGAEQAKGKGDDGNLAAEEAATAAMATEEEHGGTRSAAASSTEQLEKMGHDAAADVEPLPPWDPIRDELAYTMVLNRVLPPDIRILAWCPSPPPDFSARFSCHEREYRYFFTEPAFNPPAAARNEAGGSETKTTTTTTMTAASGSKSGAWPSTQAQPHVGRLDLDAMRDAARRFVGTHDFRNFCKVDPAKSITNFTRTIYEADVYEAADMSSALPFLGTSGGDDDDRQPSLPKVYYFRVRGSAFLWHQIRHMVAVLFLIAQRLEQPSLVDELLDVGRNPRRPTFPMADEVPLVLWDCAFRGDGPDGGLPWVYAADDVDPGKMGGPRGQFHPVDVPWQLWRERKMDEVLANGFLRTVAAGGQSAKPETTPTSESTKAAKGGPSHSIKFFEGGNQARPGGKHVPVMQMRLMETVEEQNDRFARRKGFVDAEDMRRQKMLKWEAAHGNGQDE